MSKGESTRAARSTVPSPPKTKAMSARSISFVSARESSASSIGSWPALRSLSLTVFAASSDAGQSGREPLRTFDRRPPSPLPAGAPQRDEGHVRDHDVDGFFDRNSLARIDALVHDDPRVLMQLPIELAPPDVDRVNAGRAALQENIGEPTGRRADIDGDLSRDIEPDRIERARQLAAAARHVLRAGIDPDVRIPGHGGSRPISAATVNPHRARQDEGLRALAARREPTLHQELTKP